ncbi:MAG: alanine dehydrogenase [SAR202 cluster bacterium]|nr:alanine dehydrogenase [SAR202 cluster bacterium]
MGIGIPREIKDGENRVALTPTGAQALEDAGHDVYVQRNAGAGSGFTDEQYVAAGADIVDDPSVLFSKCDLVVKVKEPLGPELGYLRPGLTLFTYLHLAAAREAAEALLRHQTTGIAYETVRLPDGSLPLLQPMSEVAGRLSAQIGARYLERHFGGMGTLLGGVPGVPPAKAVVIGAGTVGTNAAIIALGMGAHVTIIDKSAPRLRYLTEVLRGSFETVVASSSSIAEAVRDADLVIGAVLIAGASAPRVVTRRMVASMKPGAVIVDVAVDQGGCIETTRPTSHHDPVYEVDGVIHYCVTNMPGAVPRTSTMALTNATLPYVIAIAHHGPLEAMRLDPALASGLNTHQGRLTNAAVAEALRLPCITVDEALGRTQGD